MKTLALSILYLASVALAEDFKAIDGKEYKDATVSRVEPDGIVLMSSSGISKVYFTELPKEVQERFHYYPGKAPAQANASSPLRSAAPTKFPGCDGLPRPSGFDVTRGVSVAGRSVWSKRGVA